MKRHIELIKTLIQKELESFPRAIEGSTPIQILEEKADKVRLLKDIKEVLEEQINSNEG